LRGETPDFPFGKVITMDVKLAPDTVATALRYARPARAFLVVPNAKHGEFLVEDCEVPNLESLEGLLDQGFDPLGPTGPAYWRFTKSHYYSTMLTEKGVVLAITKRS
jgi:hypothetical protein